MRDLSCPPLFDLPPKYATVYAAASPADRERMARLTAQWRRSQGRSVEPNVPMVPGTLTYMPQPRYVYGVVPSPTCPAQVRVRGGTLTYMPQPRYVYGVVPSPTCPAQVRVRGGTLNYMPQPRPLQETAPPKPYRSRTRHQSRSSLDSESDCDSSVSNPGDRARLNSGRSNSGLENPGEICGISGRRQLVSGFGYSNPEILNPSYDELDTNLIKTEYVSSKRRKMEREVVQRRANRGRKKIRETDVERPILVKGSRGSPQYGADQCTDVTLSTGVKIGKIPLLSPSSGNSRSRSSSRSRRVENKDGSVPESDIIQNLGLASGLSVESTVKSLVAANKREENKFVSSSEHEAEEGKTPQSYTGTKKRKGGIPGAEVGSLGAVEVKLKYQAVQQQLVMTIVSALQLPSRFHNPEAKLYVKILIGSSTRYTTPTVPGRENPSFCCTLVHRVPSTRLHRTPIRISVCQLDLQNRRVVIGFATIDMTELWPILHLTTKLTHNLIAQHLMLSLSDSTPQHQIDCGGNITFGLLRDLRNKSITISSVTLQDIQSNNVLNMGNCLVYLKATIYQGKEIVCWRRSQPVVLNRQRTHLVHLLVLKGESGKGSTNPVGSDPIGRTPIESLDSEGTTSPIFLEERRIESPDGALYDSRYNDELRRADTPDLTKQVKPKPIEQAEETSLTEYIESILSEKLKGMAETESLSGEEERKKLRDRQTSTSSSRGEERHSLQSLSDDGTVFYSGPLTLHTQLSSEEEAMAARVMLVLSVRLKTLKRGGRCILGAVHLGEDAPTVQGRSHWQRAAVGCEVPAAGTHLLTHV
ncbi:C2 domain [Trinorchestia longiramus]|nr:C2 domain [Trinorchestia longiramus]